MPIPEQRIRTSEPRSSTDFFHQGSPFRLGKVDGKCELNLNLTASQSNLRETLAFHRQSEEDAVASSFPISFSW